MTAPPIADTTLYSDEEGRAALDWIRQNSWTGGLYVLVSTHAYTGRPDPEWCALDRVSPGTASVYPIKARIPDAAGRILDHRGQWKYDEILAVACLDLPELRELHPHFPWPPA